MLLSLCACGGDEASETTGATTAQTDAAETTPAELAVTTMHVVKFTREGEKDIIMANWRAHPTMTGGRTKYDLSAHVEEHSPYTMTMYFGYTNGMRGYIPSAYGWEYTCYESDCCNFKPGSGEVIRDTMLDLLNSIKSAEE